VITGVTVKGAARLVETLAAAGHDLDDLTAAADDSGRVVASLASTTAPRLTGALAASVTSQVDGSNAEIGSPLVYAPVIHNGWAAHNIAPRPFLLTALRRSEGQVLKTYTEAVGVVVGRVKGV